MFSLKGALLCLYNFRISYPQLLSSAKFVPLGFLNQFELGFDVIIPFSDFLQASPSEEKTFLL